MITAITIENFKGIGAPVRLDLRPITLLYGMNSAGKSSILHAVNYLRAILDIQEVDLDYIGGEPNGQRLGGFRNFVHKHELDRLVRLRADFTFSRGYTVGGAWLPEDEDATRADDSLLGFDPSRGWVELGVGWHHATGAPHVIEYAAGMTAFASQEDMTEEQFEEEGFRVVVKYNPDRRESRIQQPEHLWREKGKEAGTLESEPLESFREHILWFSEEMPMSSSRGALPAPERLVEVEGISGSTRAFLTKLLVEPYEALQAQLLAFHWIAAWRDVPPRPLVGTNFPLEANWSGGLAAWHELLDAGPELIAELSQWLTAPDKLDLGFSLRVHSFALLDRDSPLWTDLLANRAFDTIDDLGAILRKLPAESRLSLFDEVRKVELHPQDIGMGLLHVIPVLTACLRERSQLLPDLWGLDEPELHLHPRAQAALGDLLLDAVRTGDDWPEQISFIGATHSEHLVLRLLRRIRESNRAGANGTLNPNDVGIWHVDRSGESMTLKRIRVDTEGEFVEPWPEDDSLFEQDFRERYT
jgi:hypothetical protein